MSVAAAMKRLFELGVSPDDAVEVVALIESAFARTVPVYDVGSTRTKKQERDRRHYERTRKPRLEATKASESVGIRRRNPASESVGQTSESVGITTALARGGDNPLRLEVLGEEGSEDKSSSPPHDADFRLDGAEPEKPPKRKATKREFEEFWAEYPRKVGKDTAMRDYARAFQRIGGGDPPAVILDGLRRLLPGWATRDKSKVPHASTWLNRGGWNDEEDEAPKLLGHTVNGHDPPKRSPFATPEEMAERRKLAQDMIDRGEA